MNEAGGNAVYYWIMMTVYFIAVITIGWKAFARQRLMKNAVQESNDYWVAERKTNGMVVGMSIAAGWILIGFITWAIFNTYMYGLGGIWAMVFPWFVLILFDVWFVKHVRRIRAISQPQMLQQRFGLPLRVLVTPFNVFGFILWSAAEVWAISHIVAPEFAVSPWVMYLVFTIPVALYMFLGGFQSVLGANVLQFFMAVIFMTIVTVAIAVVAFRDLPTGTGLFEFWRTVTPPGLEQGNSLQLFSLGVPFIFISLWALLPGWAAEEDWWLKAQSATNTVEARKGLWANFWYNLIWVLICGSLIGLFALVVFPPDKFAAVLGEDAYAILPIFLSTQMPDWALVPLFAMLAALSMSTVATFSNVCALNGSYDVLQPLVYRKRGWSDERIMKFHRGSSVVAVGATIIAAFMIDLFPKGLWDLYYMSSGVLSAGVGVPVFAMFWKRANFKGAFLGSAVGGFSAVPLFFVETYVFNHSYSPQWLASTWLGYAVVAVALGLLTMVVVSLATERPAEKQLSAVCPEPCDDHEEFFRGVAETS